MTLTDLRSLLIVARAYRQTGHEEHALRALEDAIKVVDEMIEAHP